MESGEDQNLGFGQAVGERIRTIRRQKRLSLQDVEIRSDAEFKASVLGAYERGERSISLPRLYRLSQFYNVPVDQMLPSNGAGEGIFYRDGNGVGISVNQKVVIDLNRLSQSAAPEVELVNRYLTLIQVKRQDFNGRVLTIRRDDLQALAAILDTGIDEALPRLAELGLLRPTESN